MTSVFRAQQLILLLHFFTTQLCLMLKQIITACTGKLQYIYEIKLKKAVVFFFRSINYMEFLFANLIYQVIINPFLISTGLERFGLLRNKTIWIFNRTLFLIKQNNIIVSMALACAIA